MRWAGSTNNHQVQGVEVDAICALSILYEFAWAWSDLFDPIASRNYLSLRLLVHHKNSMDACCIQDCRFRPFDNETIWAAVWEHAGKEGGAGIHDAHELQSQKPQENKHRFGIGAGIPGVCKAFLNVEFNIRVFFACF